MSPPVVIHWFRKGLRLHDNPALLKAVDYATQSGYHLRPVFILDPQFTRSGRVGANRWRFLVGALSDLDSSLQLLGSRLLVCRGSPETVLPKLIREWDVRRITFETDTEPYAVARDARVAQLARELSCAVTSVTSHTLYEPAQVLAANGGKPPLTYQRMVTLVEQLGAPVAAEPAPRSLPPPGQPAGHFSVPSLAELGVDAEQLGEELYPGGETEGLARLERSLARPDWVCRFEKPKTAPNSLQPSTTVLSPYVKFGCVSARLFYHRLADVYSRRGNYTRPPVSLHGQLLWREFFYVVGANTPNFDRMEGNAICRQIPWIENEEFLKAWSEGRTGYPWIDAVMTQLRQEGWIHHLARHAVACFLTRGDLFISWEHGMKVFDELLLDADWSLNAANWMWLSASAFFHQFFRVYSPVAFGKKTDPNGDYIKKYLPKLRKYPSQYIYEPWKAPIATQKAAGCIVGRDYPKPIVDHDKVRPRNIEWMAAAYKKGKAAHPAPAAGLGADSQDGKGHSGSAASSKSQKRSTQSNSKSPSKKTRSKK
ncbi:cryptochrome-2-like isoform X1 [Amphibalanus amphitrite]|nr:cryptochrome-2-like isoform X1 [Amphibalanus amphitrite]XP_043227439.1 cryptochrome-2-like isoform X1 [Amphibalanus amphitrite]XP_043227441.1 cryptochrome-2-like isoform X1 [Amphibalanus amphitrite]XP_043227442.1 cryptochrome-2-like isoform X1 [Amphibalanus amphitrite]XP_043227443.1 cryptochrome-2-like isoform X1 [Amphibalanus amphitrite]XP_043227444.1 cryptochrome-2-like isoform X1 [Amphibalanus amphitrite]XP_043227445.1 cryptochrome-2-like isoform X1 [Amphibalanus amphitrite]XP_04322744